MRSVGILYNIFLDLWRWFHQGFMISFYMRRSQKRHWRLDCLFGLLGSVWMKALHKHVGEIDPRNQFHQRSASSFYTKWSQKHNKNSQVVSLFCPIGICVLGVCTAAYKFVLDLRLDRLSFSYNWDRDRHRDIVDLMKCYKLKFL